MLVVIKMWSTPAACALVAATVAVAVNSTGYVNVQVTRNMELDTVREAITQNLS